MPDLGSGHTVMNKTWSLFSGSPHSGGAGVLRVSVSIGGLFHNTKESVKGEKSRETGGREAHWVVREGHEQVTFKLSSG